MVESDTVSETKLSESEIYLGICKENYEGTVNPVLEIAHTKKRAFLKLKPSFYLEVEYSELIESTRGKKIIFSILKNGTIESKAIPVLNVLNFSSRILFHIENISK